MSLRERYAGWWWRSARRNAARAYAAYSATLGFPLTQDDRDTFDRVLLIPLFYAGYGRILSADNRRLREIIDVQRGRIAELEQREIAIHQSLLTMGDGWQEKRH